MELILLYIWMRLDLWIATAAWSIPLSLLTAMFFFIHASESGNYKWRKSGLRVIRWVSVPCFLFAILCPSAKETAVLVAGHYAIQFSNSVEGQKVKTLLQMTANNMLDDAIKSQTRK